MVVEGKSIINKQNELEGLLDLSQDFLAIIYKEKVEPAKNQMSKLREKILNLEKVNQQLKNDIGESLRIALQHSLAEPAQ